MAAPIGGSVKEKKGKKAHKNKPTSAKYKHYSIEGGSLKRGKYCPRCGAGIFLMQAKDRAYCGKCHYTEFTSEAKKPEIKK